MYIAALLNHHRHWYTSHSLKQWSFRNSKVDVLQDMTQLIGSSNSLSLATACSPLKITKAKVPCFRVPVAINCDFLISLFFPC